MHLKLYGWFTATFTCLSFFPKWQTIMLVARSTRSETKDKVRGPCGERSLSLRCVCEWLVRWVREHGWWKDWTGFCACGCPWRRRRTRWPRFYPGRHSPRATWLAGGWRTSHSGFSARTHTKRLGAYGTHRILCIISSVFTVWLSASTSSWPHR